MSRSRVSLALVSSSLVLALVACGGEATENAPPMTPASGASAKSARPVAPRVKVTQLSRSGVREVVRGGIGRFLQDVTLDDTPAFRDGKFLGFRVTELHGDLEACELAPGDVITRVNGQPIEHPEDAMAVFQALASAKELVVDYERQGKAQKLRLPIVD